MSPSLNLRNLQPPFERRFPNRRVGRLGVVFIPAPKCHTDLACDVPLTEQLRSGKTFMHDGDSALSISGATSKCEARN